MLQYNPIFPMDLNTAGDGGGEEGREEEIYERMREHRGERNTEINLSK